MSDLENDDISVVTVHTTDLPDKEKKELAGQLVNHSNYTSRYAYDQLTSVRLDPDAAKESYLRQIPKVYTLYHTIHYTLYHTIHYTLYTIPHYTLYTIPHYKLYHTMHYTTGYEASESSMAQSKKTTRSCSCCKDSIR